MSHRTTKRVSGGNSRLHVVSSDLSIITCLICGREFKILGSIHLQVHGLTRQEYMEMYDLTADRLTCTSTRLLKGRTRGYRPFLRADIQREILRAHRKIGRANPSTLRSACPTIYAQARRYFGSWDNAVASAGLDPAENRLLRDWDGAAILKEINKLRKSGRNLGAGAIRKEYPTLIGAAWVYFGGWRNAVRAAGLSLREEGLTEDWSREKVVSELRKLRRHRGGRRDRFLYNAATRLFGSSRAAVLAAGLDPDKFFDRKLWGKKEIVAAIHARRKAGLSLNPSVVLKEDGRLSSAVYGHFGSWTKALKATQIEPSDVLRIEKWSRKIIVQRIRKMRRLGKKVSNYAYIAKREPKLLAASIRYFGGWRQAMVAAGIDSAEVGLTIRWSREKILKELRDLWSRGFHLSRRNLAKTHAALLGAVTYHFGGLIEAKRLAGIPSEDRTRRRV